MREIPSSPVEEPQVERLPPRAAAEPLALTPGRRRAALLVAMAADALQWVALPLFLWGAASPMDDVVDVLVGLVLIRLIGFHWALLPACIAELVPLLDLVPTWTAAVWLATRGRKH